MANHKSTEKRIRQTVTRTERNKYYRTRLKNITKNVIKSISENNFEESEKAFKIANKTIHSFVSKGFLKKQTASRRVSRLNKLFNTLKVKSA